MLTMVLNALFSSKNDCSALGSAAGRRPPPPPASEAGRHDAANFGQTGLKCFGLRGHIGGQVALHQGCKLVLHRIHFLMAFEAMLHPLHGKKSELVLGAQGGHERGTLADARIVHDGDVARIDLAVYGQLERINAGNHLRPMRTGGGGALHHVHLILEVVPQGGRVVILQVPVDAVETNMRREDASLGSGQPVVGIRRALDGRRRGAGHGADQIALRIEDLELDGPARLVAEVVIHDRAVRHIGRMGHFDGEGLIPVAVDACANGLLGLEEIDGRCADGLGVGRDLAQRRDVVENPEAAAVGGRSPGRSRGDRCGPRGRGWRCWAGSGAATASDRHYRS